MRSMIATAVVCISIAGTAAAGEAQAAIRRPTSIPDQLLDDALQVLAKERDVQMIYPYAAVAERHTGGAQGELTVGEALDQLLADTGLQYRYLDDETITISSARQTSNGAQPTAPSQDEKGAQKSSFWGPFRLAQVAAGQASAEPVVSGSEREAGPAVHIEEVVVTALRREQRAQDVPAAISVLSGEDMNAKGAQDMRDYLTTVPGVNYSEGNVGAVQVTIRGIADGIGSKDPLTGIYLDETSLPVSAFGTIDPDIYDVERVEVLKGPQGTLYGAGSMGGTVRIITSKPELDVFDAAVRATASSVDHGGTGGRLDGVINVPILQQRLALRASAGHRKDGGWIDDVPRSDEDANTIEKQNARVQLLLQPADRTSLILGFLSQKEEVGLPPFDDPSLPDYKNGKVYRQSRGSDAQLLSLTLNQDWDEISLVSASSYLKTDGNGTFDATSNSQRALIQSLTGVTLGPSEGLGLEGLGSLHQFTQEIRLSSTGDSWLEWLAGAFYSDAALETRSRIDLSQAPSVAGILSSEGYFNSNTRRNTRQVAAFSELTFNITEKLSVTAGLRHFNIREENSSRRSGVLTGGDSTAMLQFDESSSTKKISAQFEFSRDHMIYTQAAQGYRNGGANDVLPPPCEPALVEAGYDSAPSAFGPDDLWNYEIGSKNTLFNGHMQLNAAAFYIAWSDMQTMVPLSCGFSVTVNAGEATSKGVELETVLQPLEGLTLNFSGSYVDAKLTSVAPGVASPKDDRLPLIANWSWNASALYERKFGSNLTGFLRGEVNYVGDRWSAFWPGPRSVLMDSFTTANARLGLQTDRWSAALFATNLTDERYVLNVNLPSYEVVGRPRTIGVEVRVGF